MDKINHFYLASPFKKYFDGIGYLHSPTLREIFDIGIEVYDSFINFLAINVERYLELIDPEAKEEYLKLSEEDKKKFTLFNLIIMNNEMRDMYKDIFSFFLSADVAFNRPRAAFLIYDDDEKIIGIINSNNFEIARDYILQYNFLDLGEKEIKCKNKKAREILEKIKNAKLKIQKNGKRDKSLEISNIIFKLSSRHNSINSTNIWDMTVYQLYAEFYEQIHRYQNDIYAMNYATYGGDFDITEWYKPNK